MTDNQTDDFYSRVAEAYSSGADVYKKLWGPMLSPYGEELVAALSLERGARVLDAGTGVGSLLPVLSQAAAPGATVIGADGAMGMIQQAPRDYPLALVNLNQIGFADGVFDAAVAAFVLFHLSDPRRAVRELARVLRAGGVLGTLTWGGDPDFHAQRVWLEELDAHGAVGLEQALANHTPVSTTTKMKDLLEAEDFTEIRTWKRPFDHSYAPEEFLKIRTRLGSSRRRFMTLSEDRQQALLETVRRRFAELPPKAFVDPTWILFTCGKRH